MQVFFTSFPFKIVSTIIRAVSVYVVRLVLVGGASAVKGGTDQLVNSPSFVTRLTAPTMPMTSRERYINIARNGVRHRLENLATLSTQTRQGTLHTSVIRHIVSVVLNTLFPNFIFKVFLYKIIVSQDGFASFAKSLRLGLSSRYNELAACFYFTTLKSVIQPNFQGLNPCIETPY